MARCFQLRDAFSILELDRVLDASPDELEAHRVGLKVARQRRLDTIARCTETLLARMDAAATQANSKVLLHPSAAPAVVQVSGTVVTAVQGFHKPLGIESGRDDFEARRWVDAAGERVDAVRRGSGEAYGTAKSVTRKFAGTVAERAARLRRGDAKDEH